MKKRIGNDIAFTWTVNRKNGELLVPESFEGKECMVRLIDDWGNAAVIDDVTFSTGQVTWLFKGKNQKRCSTFTAVLYENQGEDEMVTVDKVKAVTLVAHSYMEDDEECPCGTVEVESVEIESEITAGGSSTPIDAYTKEETDELLAGKVDVLQIQGGYTASRYMSGTSFSDNSDQQGRVRSAAYEVGGITLVDLNGNIAILQVNGVLQLNGKALATEDDTALLVDGGDYNSQSKEIELKHGNTVLARIDARAFVKDGMVDSVVIENGYIVITFNTDAGKEAISLALTDIFNPANYYDKTAVDNLLANKVDKVSGKGLSTEDYTTAEKTKLGGLPTNTELTTALAGKANTSSVSMLEEVVKAYIYNDNITGYDTHPYSNYFELSGFDNTYFTFASVETEIDGYTYTGRLRCNGGTNYGNFSENAKITAKKNCRLAIAARQYADGYLSIYVNGSYSTSFKKTSPYVTAYIELKENDVVTFRASSYLIGSGTYLDIYGFRILQSAIERAELTNKQAEADNNELSAVTRDEKNTWNNKSDFSGSYNDLSDKPTIPDVTTKADKVSNATNGNFAALDSNGNLTDSGHKHSDYLTSHQDLSNYVQKSQTAGLLKNDGTVDTTQYLSQHQDISGKEDITPIEAVASGTTAITAQVNKYYEVAGTVSSLTVTLPTPTANTEVTMVVVHLTVGASPTVVVTSVNEIVKFSAAYSVVANKEYELSCLYNGSKWIVSSMEVAV